MNKKLQSAPRQRVRILTLSLPYSGQGGRTALIYAAERDFGTCVKVLLLHNADVNLRTRTVRSWCSTQLPYTLRANASIDL